MLVRVVVMVATLLALGGCGASASTGSSTADARASAPQSLEEAMIAEGLSRVDLEVASRETTTEIGGEPSLEGRAVRVIETAGWNAQPSTFARRDDGSVVLVVPRPEVIIDRTVPGGCRPFVGGRRWFEAVAYTLPEGATFAGTVTLDYEEHTEQGEYTETQPDGTPCPPLAID